MIKVIIADDQELIRESLKIVLDQNEDIEVTGVAENGQILMDMLTNSQPDVILMDVRMPELDGLEATEAIRALDRPDARIIPIIAMTANAFDEDVQRSLQVGMNAHLSKPVDPERLYQTLEELIWEYRGK